MVKMQYLVVCFFVVGECLRIAVFYLTGSFLPFGPKTFCKKRRVVVFPSPLLLFSAGFSTLCHSDDADSSVVMTFHHCHANISRSLWPAVSLSPIISTTRWPASRLLSMTGGDIRTSVETQS